MTFGHAALGVAIARAYERDIPVYRRMVRTVLFVVAALLPDVDFLLFPYVHGSRTPFAHRGVTHSMFAAFAGGLFLWLVMRLMKRPDKWRAPAFAFVAIASHPVADLLTTRGRGLAVFWPFSAMRVPVFGIVPAAPFPPEFWTSWFWPEAAWEIAFALPLCLFALLPARRPSS